MVAAIVAIAVAASFALALLAVAFGSCLRFCDEEDAYCATRREREAAAEATDN